MELLNNSRDFICSQITHSKPTLGSKDKTAINTVISNKMIANGEKVKEFERGVSTYLGLTNGVATSSGSAAIYISLKALGVGSNDEVILPTYVCPSVLYAVKSTQATPVLCDINRYWNIDYSTIKPHLSTNTKAIIAPHIGGIPIDIEPITKFGIPVIEDLAQSFGAEIDGKKIGTFGEITICSFQAIKCLTTGEGGMILSNNDDIISKIREMQILSPMSDIQAALGISQLSQYPNFLDRRQEIAANYFKGLDEFPGMCMPSEFRKNSMFFRFPIIVKVPFNELKARFEAHGIAIRQFIDCLLHRQLGYNPDVFPNAEKCFKETMSIPIYPSLTDSQVKYVIKICRLILFEYLQLNGEMK